MTCSVVLVIACLAHLITPLEVKASFPVLQYDPGLRRVLNCYKDAQVRTECDPEGYRVTVITHAAPAFVVACLLALFVPLYLISKYMCNCCGGRRQTPNFCCPLNTHAAKYDVGDLLRPVVLSVAVFCVCVASGIWGCVSLHHLNSHLSEIRDLSNAAVKRLDVKGAELLEGMTEEVYNVSEDSAFSTSLLKLTADSEALQKTIAEASSELSRMLNVTILALIDHAESFSWWPYVIFSTPIILSFLGLLCALCNWRQYIPMFLLLFMTFLGIMVWVLNGLFAASSFFIGEGCLEVTEFSNRRTNVVMALTDCNDTKFGQHLAMLETLFREQAQLTCSAMLPHCYDDSMTPDANVRLKKTFSCPTSMPCVLASETDMISLLETAFYTSSHILNDANASVVARAKGYTCSSTLGNSCDLKGCAQSCFHDGRLSDVGRIAKTALYATTSLAKARRVFESTGKQFGSCEAVFKDVVPSLEPSCTAAAVASRNTMNALGFLGLATVASLFAYGMGAKRFIPFSQALLPQRN